MAYDEQSRVLVSVATYNESENIGPLVEALLATLPTLDVLIIDDNSPDGTGQLADNLANANPRVHVIHRTGKLGLGTAIVTGLKWGLARGYDFLATMDADFSHPPNALPRLVAAMKHADVAIGSRYVPGGGISGWPWHRHIFSRLINLYSRLLLGLRARDCSGGFRCYRSDLLQRIDFDRIVSWGYSFEEEFLYRCARAGAKVTEIPIHFANRKAGHSNLNWREAAWSLAALAMVRWQDW